MGWDYPRWTYTFHRKGDETWGINKYKWIKMDRLLQRDWLMDQLSQWVEVVPLLSQWKEIIRWVTRKVDLIKKLKCRIEKHEPYQFFKTDNQGWEGLHLLALRSSITKMVVNKKGCGILKHMKNYTKLPTSLTLNSWKGHQQNDEAW